MPRDAKDALLAAVDTKDLAALRNALAAKGARISPRVMGRAAQLGWKRGLEALVKGGGDLNAAYKGYRPLHSLIQEKPHEGGSSTPERVALVGWMLEHGADPELQAAWPSARALLVAAWVGEPAYVEALVDGGARIDVFALAALGQERKLAALLGKDRALAAARDGEGGLTALQCCAGSRMGRADAKTARSLTACARLLLDAGAEPDARTRSWSHDVTAATLAIGSHQIDTLALLLERGADPTAALSAAAWNGTGEALDLVLARGAKLDAARDGGKPVLNQLVRWGQFELARRLLAKGASPNEPDERGWTAVHQAVSRGNTAMLRDLVAAGGDPNRRDGSGKTPRGMAKASGRANLLEAIAPV